MSGLPATNHVGDVCSSWSNINSKSFYNLDENSSSFLRDDADEYLFNSNNSMLLEPTNDHCASDSWLHDEQFLVFINPFDDDHLLSSSIDNLDFAFEELDELICGFDNYMPGPTNDRFADGLCLPEGNNHENNNNMFVSVPVDCEGGYGLSINEDNNNNSNNVIFTPPPGDCGSDLGFHNECNNEKGKFTFTTGVQLHNEDEGNNNSMFVSVPGYCGSDLRLHNECNNEKGMFTFTTGNNMFIPPPGDFGSLDNECNNEKGMFTSTTGVQLHNEDEGNNNMFIPPPGDCGSDIRLHNEFNNGRGRLTSTTGVQLHNDEDEGNNKNNDRGISACTPDVCESDLRLPNEDNNNITREINSKEVVKFVEYQTWSPTNQGIENYSSILQDIPQKKRSNRTKVQDCSWSLPLEEEQHQRKRKGKSENVKKRECSHCATTETPQWRNGPQGKGTLCNACGVKFKSGKLHPDYRPASSPTFDGAKHSNFQKKISRMKSRDSSPPLKLCIRQNQFQYSSVDGLNPVALVGLEQGYKEYNYLREDSNAVIHQVHEHVGYSVNADGSGSNLNQNMHN